MSEAVIERRFPKIKLTLTDTQTQLNNLDALMRMSFKNGTLVAEAVQQIIETQKRQHQRTILFEDI